MTGDRDGAPAGVLLAAGAGTRFGGPKALARLDGETLLARGVRTLRDGGCEPVLAVVGAEADRVLPTVHAVGAEPVVNEDWDRGIASSVRAGLEALRERAGAAVIALADQPLVGDEAVRRLVRAWDGGAIAAVATYDGAPRNPVLLDASVWDAVSEALSGDDGARVWLRAHPEHVTHVECGAVGSATDVDTVEDLAALAGQEERTWS